MEIYRDIPGFESLYQVSNLGNVKSLKFNGGSKEKILKTTFDHSGYKKLALCKNKKRSMRTVHQLVAMAFLNHVPCSLKLVVDHIDGDRENNTVSNLRIVTNRTNTNQKHIKSTSKYTGVSWKVKNKKWEAKIKISGKSKYLGIYENELDAHKAYELALSKIID